MNDIKAVLFDFDNTLVDYIRSDIIGLKSVMELLPTKMNTNEFIEVSVEKINEFHKLVKDGKEIPSNMHKYRLYNTL